MLKKFKIYHLFFSLILVYSCANQGELTGGPKDMNPPGVKAIYPENYSVSFSESKFEISFDEYVRLNNFNQKLMVSPPLEEKPEARLKGKTLVVDLKDNQLEPNTTYTFDFGDAIVDITEGNGIEDFQYVLSTGEMMDSLRISGIVTDAFTGEPKEDVLVMFYLDDTDTLPMKSKPNYLCKTNEKGVYKIRNIKEGKYMLFGLADANNNLRFDLPNEEIAFLDSLVIPEAKLKLSTDTVQIDSTETDTVITFQRTVYTPDRVDLKMFAEDHIKQYVLKKERTKPYKLDVIFNRPLKEDFIFNVLGEDIETENMIIERYENNDSVTVWLLDSLDYKRDTIKFDVTYYNKDSLENYHAENDTTILIYKKPKEKKKDKDVIKAPETVRIESNVSGNVLHPKRNFIFTFSAPIKELHEDKIYLYKREDTLKYPKEFTIKKDEDHPRKYHLIAEWEEDANYMIFLDTAAVIDYYGHSQDSLEIPFNCPSRDTYGTLILTMRNVKENLILQILDNNDMVLKEVLVNKNKKLRFNNLKPKDYRIRIIYDVNNNGKWDTGKYIFKRQPEKVLYFEKTVTVKENWEIDEDWVLDE